MIDIQSTNSERILSAKSQGSLGLTRSQGTDGSRGVLGRTSPTTEDSMIQWGEHVGPVDYDFFMACVKGAFMIIYGDVYAFSMVPSGNFT